jgi:hypothetical protein
MKIAHSQTEGYYIGKSINPLTPHTHLLGYFVCKKKLYIYFWIST